MAFGRCYTWLDCISFSRVPPQFAAFLAQLRCATFFATMRCEKRAAAAAFINSIGRALS